MHFRIKQAETEDELKAYYQLRWKILRAPCNQPAGSEVDELEEQCFHIMATAENEDGEEEVIGVARLQFNSDTEAQLRYMAVAGKYERKGIGRQLMNAMEQYSESSGCRNIVLDAREPAVAFYQKLGYRLIEKSYLLFGEIQHFRMQKEL